MTEHIGPYEVLDVLGSGGQATTVRARNEDGAVVALKLFPGEDADVAQREATLLETVNCPGVAQFLGTVSGQWRGEPVFGIAQQFIDGLSLQDLIDDGRFVAEGDVLGIARQLLTLAGALHDGSPSVVHRDIKPPNVIVTHDGALFLVDFGGSITSGEQGEVVGTVGYTAPEQFFGEAGPQADLYSIGATLLHLVTRKHPSEFPMRDLRYDLGGRLSCGAGLERLIRALLEPDLDARPTTARAAAELLDERVQEPNTVTIERTPESLIIDVPISRPRLSIQLTALTVLLGACLVLHPLLSAALFALLVSIHWLYIQVIPLRRDRLNLSKSAYTLTFTTFGVKRQRHGEVRPGFALHDAGRVHALHDFETMICRDFGISAEPRDIRRASTAIRTFLADKHDEQVQFDFSRDADQINETVAEELTATSSS